MALRFVNFLILHKKNRKKTKLKVPIIIKLTDMQLNKKMVGKLKTTCKTNIINIRYDNDEIVNPCQNLPKYLIFLAFYIFYEQMKSTTKYVNSIQYLYYLIVIL
ncbi:hypothetical protein EGW08_014405 [Elysia chlorotica]|uniref:Uncharacterized protein n=1 Tax=Elysia chlorotica TaxID=188477 RepID=A0A3S1B7H2_ELYCH|nr:hypothetical protein EGW08_014405 [Elysia chlorotica]